MTETTLPDPFHVYPLGDIWEHVLDALLCPCNPVWDHEHQVVIHNAFNRREHYELRPEKARLS